jgi:hypothetical protein
MTATVTLTASPEAHLGTGLLPATRHRVVAIGSGLGGLTATKALKHDLVTITDALVFVTRLTAQGTAHVHTRASLWLHVIPTTAAVFIAVGVLITLYAAIIRERKSKGTPKHFSCDGRLGRPQQTRKGWH